MTPVRPPPDDGIQDEVLMMFADGTLDDDMMRQVSRALETDPALAERLVAFSATRDRLKGAFSKPINEPPPERLIAAIMAQPAAGAAGQGNAADIVPLESRRGTAAKASSGLWLPMALAAGFAGIAAGVAGFVAGQDSARPTSAVAALANAGKAALATLDTARDGQSVSFGSSLAGKVSGSYRMADRRICRIISVDHGRSGSGAEGVACQDAGQWRLELAVPRDAASTVFRPASGAGPIDALLEAGGAGGALTARDVEDLISRNWR
jgi:hypothetical protein